MTKPPFPAVEGVPEWPMGHKDCHWRVLQLIAKPHRLRGGEAGSEFAWSEAADAAKHPPTVSAGSTLVWEDFLSIFSGAASHDTTPLSQPPNGCPMTVAGELVKELVAAVNDKNNRVNEHFAPRAAAPSWRRSSRRLSTPWPPPSSCSTSSRRPSLC